MAATGPDPRRFVIVPHRPHARWRWALLGLAWIASVAAFGGWMAGYAAPGLGAARSQVAALQQRVNAGDREIAELRQQAANLGRSDQISRAANLELQATLAEREEEIAGLRADIDFYERLVGATGQRRGLNVHEARFRAESGGSWRYTVTLTQNLNRGSISKGEMRLDVEGVSGGRLRRIAWADLLQQPAPSGQAFSFRYFQALEGSIVLPPDFTPQRVRVQLRADGASVEQTFPWNPDKT